MLDGTGMCGTCRVQVGGETRFACVDGPEFDGHEVDWGVLSSRLSAYKREEEESFKLFKKERQRSCSLEGNLNTVEREEN
jgi:ferredoxin--NADP+ reductase